ncbi:putative flippase GtrA [Arcanobacterium pluranimalium]|uniref:GtrA family protein n=1 Tax=Arcanobacterium pluranimalium TaxID=108028 RepID=UPI00195A9D3F|nr:GtrA family protein [Arcanobacterium pluranimalium]MBM7824414.1 putative flippase GtrA [Arcanobacterium pluranimalium]
MNSTAKQAVLFTLLSLSAGLVEAGSFALLDWLTPLTPAWLQAISLTLSVIYNFTVNRKFTFKSANNIPIAMLKVAAFYAVFIPASSWWTAVLTDAGWNDYLVKGVTMLINFVGEFIWWKYVVFRNSEGTAVKDA